MGEHGGAGDGSPSRGPIAACGLLVAAALWSGLLCAVVVPGAGPVAVAAGTGAMAAASLVALAGRRRPLAAAAVVSGAGIALSTADTPWRDLAASGGLSWAAVAAAWAATNLVLYARGRVPLALGGAALASYAAVTAAVTAQSGGAFLLSTLSAAAPVLGGTTVALTIRLVQARRERSRQEERERGLIAERARAEERERLAADMHDIVTHQVSLMVLQAGALAVTSEDPRVRTAADEIRSAGGRAIDELRGLIGVLRGSGGDPAEPAEPARPTGRAASPAAHQEPPPDPAALVSEAEAAGQRVRFSASGAPSGLPPHTARAVYRVVQEALTNARKHAPGAAVEVRIGHRPDGADVEVVNAAPPPGPGAGTAGLPAGSGAGLDGLRHRVELLGGRLEAGPDADGGFAVRAELPGNGGSRDGGSEGRG